MIDTEIHGKTVIVYSLIFNNSFVHAGDKVTFETYFCQHAKCKKIENKKRKEKETMIRVGNLLHW
jgi:hypothetical protein